MQGLGLHCQGRNFILSHLCLNRRARHSRAQTTLYLCGGLPCRVAPLRVVGAATTAQATCCICCTWCTASRAPRNLISTPKSKASSRPVFAVAPGPHGQSTDPPSRLENQSYEDPRPPPLRRETMMCSRMPPPAINGNSCPSDDLLNTCTHVHTHAYVCMPLLPGPGNFLSKDHPGLALPQPHPHPCLQSQNARYRPLVAQRRLVLLASLGKPLLVWMCFCVCEAPMHVMVPQQ